MFFKNLKYILRSFKKDKFFVSINLLGMMAGILVTLLTGYYVYYKFSYDEFVKDHDRIYRIDYILTEQGNVNRFSKCSESLANLMQEEVPGIKDIITVMKFPLTLELDCEGQQIDIEKGILVTPNFLDYYNITYISGRSDTSVVESINLLISESFAKKHFGANDPIGKELKFAANNQTRFIISAVIKDLPSNSHIKADVISFDPSVKQIANDEDDYAPENLALFYKNIFLVLDENTDILDVVSKYPVIKAEYMQEYLDGQKIDLELTASNIKDTHYVEGIKIYFNAFPTENIRSIYYFLLLSILVIIVSIINFVNLSLARYIERTREIGVKRTFGAQATGIFNSFFLESTLQILFSFLLAYIAFQLLLPKFSEFMGISLINVSFNNTVYLYLVASLIFVIFISSLIPAAVSASRIPADIFRRNNQAGSYKGRTVFLIQVALTVAIIIITLVMTLQVHFINKADMGYDVSNTIAYEYHNWGDGQPQSSEICERLLRSAHINDVTVSTKLLGQDIYSGYINLKFQGDTHQIEALIYSIDSNYLPFMDLDLLAGENFRSELFPDSTHVIVNETFIRGIMSPQEAIGATIHPPESNVWSVKYESEIIGVVSDFHFQSMHNRITPMLLTNRRSAPNYFHIRYTEKNFTEVLAHADKIFDELSGTNIFSAKRYFPAEELLNQYEVELHLKQITLWLSLLSIFLTIFGLFSITAYNVKRDLKSLCIRKVFGAKMNDLFRYMIRFYGKALILANLIAIAISWYICTKWLERFAYRIELSIWLFIPGVIISIVILVIAISYHVVSVNRTDPAKVLQYE